MMMNIDRLDKIILSESDLNKVLDWDKENHHKFTSLEFPLNEGILIAEYTLPFARGIKIKEGLYFKHSNDEIYLATYDMSDMTKLLSLTIGEGFNPNDMNVNVHYDKAPRHIAQKDMGMKVMVLMALFQYMNHHREVVEVKEDTRELIKKAKHGKPSSKNRTTKITKLIYTINHSKLVSNDKRKYDRHTESWTQRGFWRHYKSGKATWIEPQVKGSGKVQPKTYKM
jgi:hypothetical protein